MGHTIKGLKTASNNFLPHSTPIGPTMEPWHTAENTHGREKKPLVHISQQKVYLQA